MDAQLFGEIVNMLSVAVAAMLIVLMAMAVDLMSGLRKAKQRGDFRSSQGLRMTLSKFVSYEGGMLIAVGIDILIHLCRLFALFRLDVINGIPVVTCITGVFLCVVEYLSVREKAESKTKKNFSKVEMLAIQALAKPENRELLMQLLDRTQRSEDESYGGHMPHDTMQEERVKDY